eukprot:CAMPEP_0197667370 /NCGR_PEP_ID=MMETSP1338-20131121/66102_1 /TAXON_ID=43686 ORGANISM="Pelagodinium beii, Strain RCC1491" /NCGR_SAMPLE_ID=MMETSP1338 /ASSEMBLY_ACC=CAM_ASM_000754 /LENGTH=94 /DNA_ID=CAMNT_0043246587 /DNA_START=575 /DNA_END=855 /DNA_ORIENTATION=-
MVSLCFLGLSWQSLARPPGRATQLLAFVSEAAIEAVAVPFRQEFLAHFGAAQVRGIAELFLAMGPLALRASAATPELVELADPGLLVDFGVAHR